MQLTLDYLANRSSNLREIQSPTWAAVETAIQQLDQQHHSEVILGDNSYICVSGGNGKYHVFIFTEDERNLILTDVSKDSTSVVLLAGGQSSRFENRHVVDLGQALKAAKTFFDTGKADHTLFWTEK